MTTYIYWFRRDLRLHDNPALHAALRASGGQSVPLFVLDDAMLRAPDTSAARVVRLPGPNRRSCNPAQARTGDVPTS